MREAVRREPQERASIGEPRSGAHVEHDRVRGRDARDTIWDRTNVRRTLDTGGSRAWLQECSPPTCRFRGPGGTRGSAARTPCAERGSRHAAARGALVVVATPWSATLAEATTPRPMPSRRSPHGRVELEIAGTADRLPRAHLIGFVQARKGSACTGSGYNARTSSRSCKHERVRWHRVRLQRAHIIAFVQARTSLTRDVYPLRCVHDPPVSRAFYENIGEISCDEPVGTGSANAADIQTLMRQSGTDADSGRRTSTAASSSSRYVPTGLTRWPFAERRTQSCETCPTQ